MEAPSFIPRSIARRAFSAWLMGSFGVRGVSGSAAPATLHRAAATLRSLTSYRFEGSSVTTTTGLSHSSQSAYRFAVAYSAPNRFRVEYRYGDGHIWRRVSDGVHFIEEDTHIREVRRIPIPSGSIRVLRGSPVGVFERIAENAEEAMVEGSEVLGVSGTPVACQVIRYRLRQFRLFERETFGPARVWIAGQSHLAIRDETCVITQSGSESVERLRVTSIDKMMFDEDVPEDSFRTEAK